MDLTFLFFHILFALWLTAGVFGGVSVRAATRRTKDLSQKVFGLRLAWRFLTVFVIPGALATGILGIGLVPVRGFRFSQGWVQGSLALYLAMLALTLFFLAPRLRRTLRAGEESLAAGAPTAEFQRLAASKLPSILADLNALGIVVLTYLMTVKP